MARQMSDTVSADKKSDYFKITKPGVFEGVITACRFTPEIEEKKQGERYFVDVKVDESTDPTAIGQVASWLVFFQYRYKNIRFDDGRVFSAAEQEKKDEEKLQRATAATLGLHAEDAKLLGPAGDYAGFFAHIFNGAGGDSLVVGRRVKLVAIENKNGYTNVHIEPVGEPVDPSTLPKSIVPAVPPVAAAKPSLEATLAKHGFQVHPSNAEYVFRGNDVLTVADFLAKHGG
jgi:hypothetical protein